MLKQLKLTAQLTKITIGVARLGQGQGPTNSKKNNYLSFKLNKVSHPANLLQDYIMQIGEKTNLLEALNKGIVQVIFKKIDTGELRVMPCTLN